MNEEHVVETGGNEKGDVEDGYVNEEEEGVQGDGENEHEE